MKFDRRTVFVLLAVFVLAAFMIMAMQPVMAAPKKPAAKPKAAKPAPAADKPVESSGSPTGDLVYAADVISIKGNNFVIRRATGQEFYGRVNMPNYVKDILKTDGETVACIEFTNGSQLGINKNTHVEIISTTDAKDITKRGVVEKVVLKSGTLWAKISGKESQNFRVDTGKGTLGVKGTEFVVEKDTKTQDAKVSVLEGVVEYSDTKKTQDLNPGDVLSISLSGQLSTARQDLSKLRGLLNGNFPGLNPHEQAIVSVFMNHAMGSIPAGAMQEVDQALSIAGDTMSLVNDPNSFLNAQLAEVTNRVGVSLPFGISPPKIENKQASPDEKKAKNLAPKSGATIMNYFPEFTWDKVKDAAAYRILITQKPLVKGEENPCYYAFAQVKENKLKYSPSARALKPGEKYYWTVIPLNKENKPIAAAAEPVAFTMAPIEVLGIRGLYPVGDAEPAEKAMVFDWMPIRGVTKYKFELSQKADMSSPIVIQEAEFNSVSVACDTTPLSKGTKYFWCVTPLEKSADTPDVKGTINTFVIK